MTWTEPDPITWRGYWPDDTPEDRAEREPWETYELIAIGREAGDMRVVTLDDLKDVFKQNPQLPMRLIPDNEETGIDREALAGALSKLNEFFGLFIEDEERIFNAARAYLDGETP